MSDAVAARGGGEQVAWPSAAEMAMGVAGPAAVGACVGMNFGIGGMLTMAAMVPASILGVGAVTLPGLYIGTAMLGAAPDVRSTLGLAAGALRDMGIAMLGLAPALLFMTATSASNDEATVVGSIVVFLGAALGVRAFFARSIEVVSGAAALPVFAIWAALSVGIGWQFYFKALAMTGGW